MPDIPRPDPAPGIPKQADIGILMYPGAQLSALHGLTDLFVTANRISLDRGAAVAPLRVSHWRLREGAAGLEKHSVAGLGKHSVAGGEAADQQTAVIALPCLEGGRTESVGGEVLNWLKGQHQGGAVVCSICAGAFLLARAGLLRDRTATTHWGLEDRFAAEFPEVRLETDKMIVDDGDIVTAGGVMAWVDLGLRLVDRFAGPSIMLAVAKFFLVDPSGREQRFYSAFAPRLHHGDEAVLKVQHALQGGCDRPMTIAAMAGMAGLSERTFLRRFQKATGMNPTAYLQVLRVGKARELLEFSSTSFDQIAWQVGYKDAGAFRKVFQNVMGLSPGDYRRRFAVR